MVGLEIPLAVFEHAYVITANIPESKGTPNLRDHDGSIYYKTQGTTLHMGGYELNPNIIKEVVCSTDTLDFYLLILLLGRR